MPTLLLWALGAYIAIVAALVYILIQLKRRRSRLAWQAWYREQRVRGATFQGLFSRSYVKRLGYTPPAQEAEEPLALPPPPRGNSQP